MKELKISNMVVLLSVAAILFLTGCGNPTEGNYPPRQSAGVASNDGFSFAGNNAFSKDEQQMLNKSLAVKFYNAKAVSSGPLTPEQQKLTDIALVLGGFKPKGNSLDKVIGTDEWKTHEKVFEDIWKNVDENQLSKARKWAETEVDPRWGTDRALFYPFSGPDFLYGNTFFPKAHTYVLAGLEPVGEVPVLTEMDARGLTSSLRSLQKSLDDILRWSFFRTLDMEVDFRHNKLKGVIPIIMTFMAKTGHEILKIEYVGLDATGDLVPVAKADRDEVWKNTIPGTRFTFRKAGETQAKTLVYFSVNLHDGPMAEQPNVNAFVRRMRYPACYLKSASYLMHKDYFSDIRNIILNNACMVLQDPSGMPVRYFDPEKWDRRFYGKYTGPIGLFSNYFQSDLDGVYKKHPDIPTIDFGIGYKFRVNTSSFMLAVSRDALAWKEGNMPAKTTDKPASKLEGSSNGTQKPIGGKPGINKEGADISAKPIETPKEIKTPDAKEAPVSKGSIKENAGKSGKEKIKGEVEVKPGSKDALKKEAEKLSSEKKKITPQSSNPTNRTKLKEVTDKQVYDPDKKKLEEFKSDKDQNSASVDGKLPWEGMPVMRRTRTSSPNTTGGIVDKGTL